MNTKPTPEEPSDETLNAMVDVWFGPRSLASAKDFGDMCEMFEIARAAIAPEHAAEVERLVHAERERIRNKLGCDVECPCCGESRMCADDCTFAVDCPNEAQRMASIRAALED